MIKRTNIKQHGVDMPYGPPKQPGIRQTNMKAKKQTKIISPIAIAIAYTIYIYITMYCPAYSAWGMAYSAARGAWGHQYV